MSARRLEEFIGLIETAERVSGSSHAGRDRYGANRIQEICPLLFESTHRNRIFW